MSCRGHEQEWDEGEEIEQGGSEEGEIDEEEDV